MVKNSLTRKLALVLAVVLLSGMFGVCTPYAAATNKVENCTSNTNHCLTTKDVNHTLYKATKTPSKKKHVTYYRAAHMKKKPRYYHQPVVRKIILKKKKIVTYGSFNKSSKIYSTNAVYCKNKKRTFELAKNVKFYSLGGTAGKIREDRKYAKSMSKTANGLALILKVKNGKVIEIIFSS